MIISKEGVMGFLTILLYIILSLAVGVLMVGAAINLFSLEELAALAQTEVLSDRSLATIVGLAGLIIILFSLRYIQAFFRRSIRNKAITFESPEGKVSITLFALEDMLKRMLEERKEVSHIKPKVLLKKQAIEVVVRGVLTAEVNLVDFTREIQEKIKEKMHSLLGEDKQVKVDLIIRKVTVSGKKEVVEEKEPQVPFRNYQ